MTSTLNRLLLSLAAGSVLSGLVDANGSIVSAYLTPLTTLALNAARATGTLDAAAFNQAVIALLNAFGLAAGLDILHTAPVVTGTSIDYGPALLNISRMVAAGLPLAQILSTTQTATLAAAYAAASATAVAPGAAMLVISAANPATMNRRLDKLAAQFGLVKFGDDGAFTALATAAGPQTAVSIDKTVRRISFTNLGLSGTGAALNLNGTLEYTTNVDASNRAACG